MKKLISFLLIFFLFNLLPLEALAQIEDEPLPSPDDEVIKQKVEERIEKVVSDADEEKKQALVGELKSVANTTLTVETSLGDKQAKVAEGATILDEDREEIEIEDLEIGSKMIAMGYIDNQGVIEAKRIVVVEDFQTPASEAVFGNVTDISGEEEILTIKNPNDQAIYAVEMDVDVEITQTVEEEMETIDFEDINEGDSLVVVGESEENAEKMITAKLIHVASDTTITPEEEEEE